MENSNQAEQLHDNLKKYLNTRYELAVLRATDKVSLISSITASAVIVGVFMMLFVLFVSVSAGFYLATVFESPGLGFLAVAGFYFLAGLIALVFRKKIIIEPVRNKIIKAVFNDK